MLSGAVAVRLNYIIILSVIFGWFSRHFRFWIREANAPYQMDLHTDMQLACVRYSYYDLMKYKEKNKKQQQQKLIGGTYSPPCS